MNTARNIHLENPAGKMYQNNKRLAVAFYEAMQN